MKKALLILNGKKFTPYSYFRYKKYCIIYSTDIENKEDDYINKLIEDYDLIVIGGGTQHLTEDKIESYKEVLFLKKIIKYCDEQNKLLIGICLGCQLIAYYYGCEIKKLDIPQIGYNYLDNNTLNKEEIENDVYLSLIDYNKLKGAFSFHNDYIDFKDNKELILIGNCNNNNPYIIKHKSKSIYGFQQHPEHTQETLGRIIEIFKISENNKILDDEININFFNSFLI